jgi:hypothetical protein
MLRRELQRIVKITAPRVTIVMAFFGDFIIENFNNQLYNKPMPALISLKSLFADLLLTCLWHKFLWLLTYGTHGIQEEAFVY